MNAFRVSAAALLIASVSAGAVQASDLPARHHPVMPMMPPMFSWTGFYFGANLGGAIGNIQTKHYYQVGAVTKNSSFLSGFLGGFQGGYNYQWTDWLVVGAEVDFDWTNARSSRNTVYVDGLTLGGNKHKIKYLGTVRARLGYSADRALMYITGGYAYGSMKNNFVFSYDNPVTDLPVVASAQKTKTQTGWTIGGGLEYALTHNVLVRTEYLYMGFNKSKYNPFNAAVLSGLTTRAQVSVVRAGLSYKF